MKQSLSPSELQSLLEWAGQKLLSLPVPKVKPSGYQSFWPDYPDDMNTAYGYTGIRFRPPRPSSDEIPIMDEILNLILLVDDPLIRKILQSRSLITTLSIVTGKQIGRAHV